MRFHDVHEIRTKNKAEPERLKKQVTIWTCYPPPQKKWKETVTTSDRSESMLEQYERPNNGDSNRTKAVADFNL